MKSRITLFALLLSVFSFAGIAQSTYMLAAEGYKSSDLFEDYAFTAFEIQGDTLFGFDSDGIHLMRFSTGEQVGLVARPEGYMGGPSFLTNDPAGDKLWIGFTKTGNTDDRIYTLDIATSAWTHVATFPANIELRFRGTDKLVSGLNSADWNTPNSIWLLDDSGANQHRKLIEIGGSSAGFSLNEAGDLYYATYYFSGDNGVYRWGADEVDAVIAQTSSSDFLTLDDSDLLSDTPAGAYDNHVDGAGNLLFNANQYGSPGFLAKWNESTGSGDNYDVIATTTDWMNFIRTKGDVLTEGTIYTLAWGKPIAEIHKDRAPVVADPIADFSLPVDAAPVTVDLTPVFDDPDDDNSAMTYQIVGNSNPALITPSMNGNQLQLVISIGQMGNSTMQVEAISNGQTVVDEFVVKVEDTDYTQGVFIVNEDWFGHDMGSVNYLDENGEFIYRAYRRENPDETFGVTTQFGTVYGGHFFFISKQGNRLTVADAATLEKEAAFEEIGGDGRGFVGVNEHLGYVSMGSGIREVNLDDLSLGNMVEGIEVGIGNMVQAGNYVFALSQSAVYVIEDGSVVETFAGSFGGLTRAKDGDVYAGAGEQLFRINSETLESEFIDLPDGISISSSWGAWNAGSLCSSASENTLFWTASGMWGGGQDVYRYQIGNMSSLDTPFVSIPDPFVFYGAAIRVHPETNKLYITGKQDGWGSNSLYNRFFVYDATSGEQEAYYDLEEYYWFPAMVAFPDKYLPELEDGTQILAQEDDATLQFNLNEVVSDADNLDCGVQFELVAVSDEDLLQVSVEGQQMNVAFGENLSGNATITLRAVSNGRGVDIEIPVQITPLDDAPEVANAIDDVTVEENAPVYTIDLSNVFADVDGDEISLSVALNSNESLVQTNLDENTLSLTFTADQYGEAEIVVKGTANEQFATDTFLVVVSELNGFQAIQTMVCKVYPNPVSEHLYVNVPVDGNCRMQIMNLHGQVVAEKVSANNQFSLNVSQLPKGMYVLRVQAGQNVFTSEILIN